MVPLVHQNGDTNLRSNENVRAHANADKGAGENVQNAIAGFGMGTLCQVRQKVTSICAVAAQAE